MKHRKCFSELNVALFDTLIKKTTNLFPKKEKKKENNKNIITRDPFD